MFKSIMAPTRPTTRLPIGLAATLAPILEATAPKPGNVHPGASFEDLQYSDFVLAALATGPILAQASSQGVGQTVARAVTATQNAVNTNVNLGTLLLLAPLAAVAESDRLDAGIVAVLEQLTPDDTRHVYTAIRQASAGGLGTVEQADVAHESPPLPLVEVMRLAAQRDLVARQYTNCFADVFRLSSWLDDALRHSRLSEAIVATHLRQLAHEPDSLIRRKCGAAIADEASFRASEVLGAGLPGGAKYDRAFANYDAWLRADGHRRNPGTTADLIAGALFVQLREGTLHWDEW